MPVVTLADAQAMAPGQERDWAYNALDATGTLEVAKELLPKLSPLQARTYAFEKQLQGPAMSMMMRGVRINQPLRAEMVKELKKEMQRDERAIAVHDKVKSVWDGSELETGVCPANFGKRHKWPRGVPDSPDKHCSACGVSRVSYKAFEATSSSQTFRLIYTLHGIPPYMNKQGKQSTDDDTLSRIAHKHPELAGLCESILAIRDKQKQLGALSARLTPDGRYPSSFNVGAAWTGRFSSSKNPYGLGGNLQNVAPKHRKVFIADPGMEMGYADYMQGESNIVAHLSGDPKYIEAHKGGDVHTYVTRYVWPELPWTGDLKKDKKIAKQNPPWDLAEGHDYRFQCKRIQHGSNYGLSPFGISMIAKIPLREAKTAYNRYMSEFDYIPAWQDWERKNVTEHRPIINPLGRVWVPFGRSWDKHTWRQALSFKAQSLLADINDIALYYVWLDLEEQQVQLLAQVHDALLHQVPQGRYDLERDLLKRMAIPVPVTDFQGTTRIMTIGVESATGKNWGHKSPDNPTGIDEGPIAAYLQEHPL
jgi:DNA polymerase I-like protein with 3'-5' exonuclease and polymerase domains